MERRRFLTNISLGLTGTLAVSQTFAAYGNKPAETNMNSEAQVNRLMMLSINVSKMPDSKEFYADKLGLQITTDYRMDDNNWWVTLASPQGGTTITLARASAFPESIKPGTLALYFETSDIDTAHKELSSKIEQVNDIRNDLFGPGSGVKFFILKDPDGNLIHVVENHPPGIPF